MNDQHSHWASRATPGPPRYWQWLLLSALLAASAAFGFYDLFSNFRRYDDEGFWLMVTRLILDGIPLYEQVEIPHGPIAPAVKAVLHGYLSVPLTNTATRIISLAYWIFLSAGCGLLVRRLTGSQLAGVFGYVLIFLFMRAFTNEPGHPQELIACLAVLIPLCLSGEEDDDNQRRWFGVGVLVALLLNTKINIGIFCLAAVSVVIVAGLPVGRWSRYLRPASVLLATAFPFVFMWPHWQQANCLPYAAICSGAIAAASVAACYGRDAAVKGLKDCAGFVAGVLLILLAVALFLHVNDVSIAAYVASVQHFATSLGDIFMFREYSPAQVALALTAPLLAALLLAPSPKRAALVCTLKIFFVGVTAALLLTIGSANPQSLLGWAGPWCWLCLAPQDDSAISPARKLLALLAVFHLLLAYPIPGSQLYFGTFLIPVSALVCAVDSTRYLARVSQPAAGEKSWLAQRWPWPRGGSRQPAGNLLPVLLLAGLLVFFGSRGLELRGRYWSLEPVQIPGMEWLRLDPGRVSAYRRLVAEMREADVGFTDSGLNSLYLWSGVEMAAPVVVQIDLRLVSRRRHEEIIQGLSAAERPLVLLNLARYGGQPAKTGLRDWVHRVCRIPAHRRLPLDEEKARFELMRPLLSA